MATPNSSNEIVEQQLDGCCREIEKLLGADVYAFDGPILHGADVIIRDTIESRLDSASRKERYEKVAFARSRNKQGHPAAGPEAKNGRFCGRQELEFLCQVLP